MKRLLLLALVLALAPPALAQKAEKTDSRAARGDGGGSGCSPTLINDGGTWYLNASSGNISDASTGGYGDAYDGYTQLSVNGLSLYNSSGECSVELDGRQYVYPMEVGGGELRRGIPLDGLEVVRRVYVPTGTFWARQLDSFTNTTGSPMTLSIDWRGNLGSDGNETIVATQSGDNTFTPEDRWLVTDDDNQAGPAGGDPTLSTNFWGAGGLASDYAEVTSGYHNVGFTFTVEPGETVSLMHINSVSVDDATAIARAETIDEVPDEIFTGLTASEASRVLNWSGDYTPPSRPEVSFARAQASVSEGAGVYALQLTLSEAPQTTSQVTVSLVSASPASASAASDLGGFTSVTVDIPAGSDAPVTVSIPVTNDRTREPDETFVLRLSNPTNGTALGEITTMSLTVLDDDASSVVVTVPMADANGDGIEDGGPRLLTLPVGGVTAGEIATAAKGSGPAPTVFMFDEETDTLVPVGPNTVIPAGTPFLVNVAPGSTLTFEGPQATGPVSAPTMTVTGASGEAFLLAAVGNPSRNPLPLSAITVSGGTLGDVVLIYVPAAGAFFPVSLSGLDLDATYLPAFTVLIVQVGPTGGTAARGATAVTADPSAGDPTLTTSGRSILTVPFFGSEGESVLAFSLTPDANATGTPTPNSGSSSPSPQDRLVVRIADAAEVGLDGFDGIDLPSPGGVTFSAIADGLPLAAFSAPEGGLRPSTPLTVPLGVSVAAPGPHSLRLDLAPQTIDGRPVVVEVLDNGQAFPLTPTGQYAFTASTAGDQGNRFAIRISVLPGVATESADLADRIGTAYPNPTTGAAHLSVEVSRAQRVRVAIYDAIGREVTVAHDGEVLPGALVRVALDGSRLAPGTYVVRVEGETVQQTRPFTVAR